MPQLEDKSDEIETAELSLRMLNSPAPRERKSKLHKTKCTQVSVGLTVYNKGST